ncbi:hypothetical protein [Ferrimonas marina]|uniref:Uncharacterized protein n=1 Tax=Ferrimonas marina TaxID=299255 RepID=A0A1M5NJW8_9GAMM|nr:hypothetical protein [Ferrimonas marina]SHG89840.1 hypothetical protein SAMN02745129_1084 [Ferrimonas marina]
MKQLNFHDVLLIILALIMVLLITVPIQSPQAMVPSEAQPLVPTPVTAKAESAGQTAPMPASSSVSAP